MLFLWLLSAVPISIAQPFSFDDIQFWVGSGANRAALAIDWFEDAPYPRAPVWGFRWDGAANGNDMLTAIIAADPRLFAKLGGSPANANAVYGLGYDANGDGHFALDDGTEFDAYGIVYTRPADLAISVDREDIYAEGWFTGFWHYGIANANPFDGGAWSDTPAGMAQRVLTDGAWDSWTFSPTFNFAAFADNLVPAPPPLAHGDFNRDGAINAADYNVWRNAFGSSTDLAADGNSNGVVDAADYVVWRKQLQISANSPSTSLQIPEPPAAVIAIALLSLWPLWRVRHSKQRNTIP